jgi:hypothetical protein
MGKISPQEGLRAKTSSPWKDGLNAMLSNMDFDKLVRNFFLWVLK